MKNRHIKLTGYVLLWIGLITIALLMAVEKGWQAGVLFTAVVLVFAGGFLSATSVEDDD